MPARETPSTRERPKGTNRQPAPTTSMTAPEQHNRRPMPSGRQESRRRLPKTSPAQKPTGAAIIGFFAVIPASAEVSVDEDHVEDQKGGRTSPADRRRRFNHHRGTCTAKRGCLPEAAAEDLPIPERRRLPTITGIPKHRRRSWFYAFYSSGSSSGPAG
ncbi:uncharacterized protein LOC125941559 [Dermacentor silvarum]|uniref:uncharacterized protein LOC125941559 n=1 Tax=Dermacentor silvarum TaxID=543639 RepID=UPI002100D1F0|nr:uncharacterized protein LOC125941559 [Dermacentor silvarum]